MMQPARSVSIQTASALGSRAVTTRHRSSANGPVQFRDGNMPVTVWLVSGEERVIADADGADTDGYLIWFTTPDRREGADRRTVLTLRAVDVERVEVLTESGVTEIVPRAR